MRLSPGRATAEQAYSAGVIGRAAELSAVEACLDGLATGSVSLILEGEAGIGKTTVWLAAVERAQARSLRVLMCRPVEAETPMSFAALLDLFEAVTDSDLAELPAPQRRALEIVLLRSDPGGERIDQRTVSVAVLSLLRVLAKKSPVVVAIDDAQWLDVSSAAALRFALRRITTERVGLVASVRTVENIPPVDLGVSPAVTRLEGFAAAVIDDVVCARLGRRLPGPMLAAVSERSAGNPFNALEMARTVIDAGRWDSVDGLPLPRDVQELVRTRLDRLPPDVLATVRTVGALSDPSVEQVLAAIDSPAALDSAVDLGVVRMEGRTIRLDHPLLGSVAYASASTTERRRLHRHLADVVDDVEQRARHLALAATGPDNAVAGQLDAAAHAARRRGASASAAEFWLSAARLTTTAHAEIGYRRQVEAATDLATVGESVRAKELLREVISSLAPGRERAAAALKLAEVLADEMVAGDEVMTVMAQVLEDTTDDDHDVRARLHAIHAWVSMTRGELDQAMHHANTAAEFAALTGDDRTLAIGLASALWVHSFQGQGVREDLIARGEAIEAAQGPIRPLNKSPMYRAGWVLSWNDRIDEGRPRLERSYRLARDLGDEPSLALSLTHLVDLECRAGNWARADAYADEGMAIASTLGHGSARASLLTRRGLVDSLYGRVDEARTVLKEALELSQRLGNRMFIISALQGLGFLEWSLGHAAEADSHLAEVLPSPERLPLRDPGGWWWAWSRIDALATLGRYEETEGFCACLEELGNRLDRPWALSTAARGRALIASGQGDLDAAESAITTALLQHERLGYPLDLGRTVLVKGMIERRTRRYAAARETLNQALAIFNRLGATLWAERTTEEAGRIGGRARSAGELSDQERRVVDLTVVGHTNREIAAELYVSVRAVEKALTSVYRKLGVRSRAQLINKITKS
jgi:DNA-binding CsgD family transcriptional regulator